MNLNRACAIKLEDDAVVSAIAFHPTKPVVAIALGLTISLYDLNSGHLLGQVRMEKPVTGLALNQITLVAKDATGDFCVWEYSNLELLGMLHYPHSEEKPILGVLLCPLRPLLCFSRLGGKVVFVHDVSRRGIRKPSVRLDCKRPITAIAMHPNDSIIAVYSEGVIRVWDLDINTQVAQYDDISRTREYLALKGANVRVFLSFSGDGSRLIVGNERHHFYALDFEDYQLTLAGSSANMPPDEKATAIALRHHPRFPFFWVLYSNGSLEGYDSTKCDKTHSFLGETIPELDAVEQYCYWTSYEGNKWITAEDKPLNLVVHPSLNYVAFPFTRKQPRSYFMVYSALHPQHRYSYLLNLCSVTPQADSYIQSDAACYTESFFYLAPDGQVMNCDLRDGSLQTVKDISFMLETTGITPYDIKYFPAKDQFILFFEKNGNQDHDDPSKSQESTFSVFTSALNSRVKLEPGYDALITTFASSPDVVSLGPPSTELNAKGKKYDLEAPVKRMFTSPLAEGHALLFVTNQYLIYSQNADPNYKGSAPFNFNYSHKIKLRRHEEVRQVLWNTRDVNSDKKGSIDPTQSVAGILTSHRVLIVDVNLEVLASVEAPHRCPTIYFNSIHWVGMSLLFVAETQVRYMTLDGSCYLLCDLDTSEAVIASVWNDRVIAAVRSPQEIRVITIGVGLLQPILLGELAAVGRCGRPDRLSVEMLEYVVRTYDYKRTDMRLIERLEQAGYYDLATELASLHTGCDIELKFRLALLSRKLVTAMSLLEAQCRHQKISPPIDGVAQNMAQQLAPVALKYGRYKIAAQCFELLQDYYRLFSLYFIYGDVTKLKALRKRLQSNPKYAILHAGTKRAVKNDRMSIAAPSDFDFTNSSRSYDLTPIVIPDMTGNTGEGTAHILPWAFLDTVPKWFPRRLNAQNLAPFFSEAPQDAQNVHFPCSENHIVSLFITRLKGAVSDVAVSENKLSHPPERLLPKPITRISLSREAYEVSSSSLLVKNVVKEQAKSASAIDSSELSDSEEDDSSQSTLSHSQTISVPRGGNLPHINPPPLKHAHTMNLPVRATESDGEDDSISEDLTAEGADETEESILQPEDSEKKFSDQEESATPETNIVCSLPEEVAVTVPSPTVAVTLDQNDVDKYPCTSFACVSHTGNLERRDSMRAPNWASKQRCHSPRESMNSALQMFDIGFFSSALCHIEKALSNLVNGQDAPETVRKEVKFCVYYKFAIRLLMTIKLLDHSRDFQHVAFLCRIFASVPLRQVHRIAAIAIAADKNLLARNYGAAASLLKVLQSKGLYDQQNIAEMLADCESEKLLNAVGYISTERPKCCYSTFQSVLDERYLICNFCDAIFLQEVKQPTERCCYCHHGQLEWRETKLGN